MKALLIILVVLSVLALIPVGVDGGYGAGGPLAYLKLGFFSIRVFPPGKLVASIMKAASKPKKPKRKKVEPIEEEPAEPKKPKPKPGKDEIIALAKMALSALSRFRHKLSIDYLRLHVNIAADDPYKTAMAYGAANAALSAAVPLLDGAFNITEQDIGVSCDFLAEKMQIDVWLTASIQIWEILYVAAAFAIDFIKNKKKQKRDGSEHTQSTSERTDTNGQTSNRRSDGDNPEQDKGNGGREHHRRRSHNHA